MSDERFGDGKGDSEFHPAGDRDESTTLAYELAKQTKNDLDVEVVLSTTFLKPGVTVRKTTNTNK